MTESAQRRSQSTRDQEERLAFKYRTFTGDRYAIIGGAIAIVLGACTRLLVGTVYNQYQARQLVRALVDSSLYFGAAVVTGSATVLALMLTLLGLAQRVNRSLDASFYRQVKWISVCSAIAMIGGVVMLTMMSLPLSEADNIPKSWFTAVYYVFSTLVVGLSGVTITVVLMLLTTITSMIRLFAPDEDDADDVSEDARRQEARDSRHSAAQAA